MLRITIHITPVATTLRLEGKLLADWCPELRRACDSAGANGLPAHLDLAPLTFADPAGLAEIRRLLATGAVVLGPCSNFIAALLETTQPEVL